MNELLPCPFCGGEVYVFEFEGQRPDEAQFRVHCDGCEATHNCGERSKAVSDWNKRVTSARIEALEAALRMIAEEANYVSQGHGVVGRLEEIARAALAPEQDK